VLDNLRFVSALLLLALLGQVEGPAAAAMSKSIAKDTEAMRAALEANFQACNYEDVDALVATMSKSMPGVSEFAQEAKDTFGHTDAYFRLADFELLEYRPPYATARVIQITLPKEEKDRATGTNRQIFYRGHLGLFPPWECVEYLQRFRKEGGKWKVDLITTVPKPVEWSGKNDHV
jgi:hypothetical protein